MAIFTDMVEKCIEVFMDDFLVFGASFGNCLTNLEKVLQHCEKSNLVLNWEKCHFMVQEAIVLGHKISKRGIEVDKEKLDVIDKLPPPVNVKGIRSFSELPASSLSHSSSCIFTFFCIFMHHQLTRIQVSFLFLFSFSSIPLNLRLENLRFSF